MLSTHRTDADTSAVIGLEMMLDAERGKHSGMAPVANDRVTYGIDRKSLARPEQASGA